MRTKLPRPGLVRAAHPTPHPPRHLMRRCPGRRASAPAGVLFCDHWGWARSDTRKNATSSLCGLLPNAERKAGRPDDRRLWFESDR